MPAPIHQLLIFGDEERLLDKLDLLRDFWRGFGEIEFVSAIGTGCQFELDDFVDEFRSDGLAQILLVTLLAAGLAFLTVAFAVAVGLGVFRRLDDVRRRRLGGIRGVFFENSDALQQLRNASRLLRNGLIALTQFLAKSGYDFFRVHDTRSITIRP